VLLCAHDASLFHAFSPFLCAQFRVRIGFQWSPYFSASTVAYAPPTVSAVSVLAVVSSVYGLMDTAGKDILIINGSSFGPFTTVPTDYSVVYSANALDPTLLTFSATDCYVPPNAAVTQDSLLCKTAAGAGAGLRVSVTVGGQTAPWSTGTIAYRPPVMTGSIVGRGADLATTSGGELVIIAGEQVRFAVGSEAGTGGTNGTNFCMRAACAALPPYLSALCAYSLAPSPCLPLGTSPCRPSERPTASSVAPSRSLVCLARSRQHIRPSRASLPRALVRTSSGTSPSRGRRHRCS
jgi:hypothetical protein